MCILRGRSEHKTMLTFVYAFYLQDTLGKYRKSHPAGRSWQRSTRNTHAYTLPPPPHTLRALSPGVRAPFVATAPHGATADLPTLTSQADFAWFTEKYQSCCSICHWSQVSASVSHRVRVLRPAHRRPAVAAALGWTPQGCTSRYSTWTTLPGLLLYWVT